MQKRNCSLIIATLLGGLTSTYSQAQNDCSAHAIWQSDQVYNNGDQIQHSGHLFTAKWWTRGTTPELEQAHSVWRSEGVCLGAGQTPDPTPVPDPQPPAPVVPPVVTPPADPEPPADPTPPANPGSQTCSAYSQGQSYNLGDQVYTRSNGSYECKVAGWCSSDSAAYVPGEGFAFESAWKSISAEVCSKPLPPKPKPVTKDNNPAGSPEGVKDARFPAHSLSGIWANKLTRTGVEWDQLCPTRLIDVPAHWDIVYVGDGRVVRLTEEQRQGVPYEEWNTGEVQFNAFEGYDPYAKFAPYVRPTLPNFDHLYCDALDANQLKQDIAALQARGQVVMLSIDRFDGDVDSDATAAHFAGTATHIVNEWGFDGIDIAGTYSANYGNYMAKALRQFNDNFNGDKFVTMRLNYSTTDLIRDIVDQVRINVIPTQYQPLTDEIKANPSLYTHTPFEYIVADIIRLIEGFPVGHIMYFHALRPDQVAIQIDPEERPIFTTRLGKTERGFGRIRCRREGKSVEQCRVFFMDLVKPNDLIDAISCVTSGQQCRGQVQQNLYPEFSGVVINNVAGEARRNHRLATPLLNLMNNQ